MKFIILIISFISISVGAEDINFGFNPSLGLGYGFTSNRGEAYIQVRNSLMDVNQLRMLGISYNYNTAQESFFMVTPVSYKFKNNLEIGLDFRMLNQKSPNEHNIGISFSYSL